MPSSRLTEPAFEPVSIEEMKTMLRIAPDDDDDAIAGLIRAARQRVEMETRRALAVQTWRIVLDRWPSHGMVAVWPVPLRQLTAVRVHRADGQVTTLDPAGFLVDAASEPGRIVHRGGGLVAGRPQAGIELDVEVGHGEAAHEVPDPLRQAVRLLVAHWYDAGTDRGTPPGVAALIAPYRVVSL